MKKVMIVDDSMFMRRILKDIVPDGCSVIEADSGPVALERFKAEHPDLVLLDIIMPGEAEEGISVLKSLMEIDANAQVVMITAVGQDTIIEQCKKLGAKDYITKPFDEEQIRGAIERCLGQGVPAGPAV